MKTFEQLYTSDVQQAMECHTKGLMTLSQCIIQLSELDVHVQSIEQHAWGITWKFMSYSDADSISVEEFHAGVVEPVYQVSIES